LSWVAVGVTAVSLIYQGVQQKKASDNEARELGYQKAQRLEDARAEREGSRVRAGQIRKAGGYQQSAARASLAKAGVVVDSGTGQAAQDYIKQTSEQDALTEILNGEYRARRLEAGAAASGRQAEYVRDAGNAAMAGSLIRVGATAAAGYSSSGGWKTQNNATLINEQVPGQYSTVNRQYG
jgi:hypothetical protein